MNPKRHRFCEEYLVDLNAAAAARRAGYSEKTARSIGHELLTKPDVQGRVQRLFAQRAERTELTAEWVIGELRHVYQMAMEVTENGGTNLAAANRSLELLEKHLALFTANLSVNVGAEPEPKPSPHDFGRLTRAEREVLGHLLRMALTPAAFDQLGPQDGLHEQERKDHIARRSYTHEENWAAARRRRSANVGLPSLVVALVEVIVAEDRHLLAHPPSGYFWRQGDRARVIDDLNAGTEKNSPLAASLEDEKVSQSK